MATLRIRLDVVEGESIVFDVPELASFQYLRGLALEVNGEDILRTPLIVHDRDYKQLHTLCRRRYGVYDPDDLDEDDYEPVEW